MENQPSSPALMPVSQGRPRKIHVPSVSPPSSLCLMNRSIFYCLNVSLSVLQRDRTAVSVSVYTVSYLCVFGGYLSLLPINRSW